MDWADRTEARGNVGKTADSFFHPSGPSEFGYLIQRKSLISQSKLARGVGRMSFHPVNPSLKGFRRRKCRMMSAQNVNESVSTLQPVMVRPESLAVTRL